MTDRAVRDLADAYVTSLAGLDPSLAVMLGLESGPPQLPDLSPAGLQAKDELSRSTLAALNRVTSQPLLPGRPGQAISCTVGERAWLAGREAARAAHGGAFDLKSWHMAALSAGALGLDDLATELALL